MIFSPSGGGLYHWRALTRRNLWKPFTSALEQWLESWRIPKTELVLIGPSGGHTLPSQWLEQFAKVTAFDVDSLAGPLLRLRHRRANVQFHKLDVFFKDGKFTLETLQRLREQHPHAAFLFCNVLGQLPLENRCTEAEWLHFLESLPDALAGALWASYHDVYTLEPLPREAHETVAQTFRNGGTIEDVTNALGDRSVLIYDHMTTGSWSADFSKKRWAWSLTSSSLHLLEAVFSNPTRRST